MKCKTFVFSLFLVLPFLAYGQDDLKNKEYFGTFLDTTSKSLLMVGENHSSSVGPKIFPELIKYLHKENGLTRVLIEFGPSEAYFYNLYLNTGNEKWLNYTLNGVYYDDWKKAWRQIYEYSATIQDTLHVQGIDFDRGRTFGYALYNIFKEYEEKPAYIDSLMNQVRDTTFFNNHTIGYPTNKDLKFVKETRSMLADHKEDLKKLLSDNDYTWVNRMIKNKALNFGENREANITKNAKYIINESNADDFLLFIGRDHNYRNAIYDDKPRLVTRLSEEKTLTTLAGVILHENSQQWGQGYEETITLNEVQNKTPWKDYRQEIDKKATSNLTIVPLKGDLKSLAKYTDYIIVARNQQAISVTSN